MQVPLSEFLGSAVRAASMFVDLATMSVVQGVLLAMGALLVGATMLFVGYLAFGGLLAPLGVQLPTTGRGYRDVEYQSGRH